MAHFLRTRRTTSLHQRVTLKTQQLPLPINGNVMNFVPMSQTKNWIIPVILIHKNEPLQSNIVLIYSVISLLVEYRDLV